MFQKLKANEQGWARGHERQVLEQLPFPSAPAYILLRLWALSPNVIVMGNLKQSKEIKIPHSLKSIVSMDSNILITSTIPINLPISRRLFCSIQREITDWQRTAVLAALMLPVNAS